MIVIDYNGSGSWSVAEVIRRHALYALKYSISTPRDLQPLIHATDIEGIESGDLACAEIGVEFIEESSSFSFGRILKANTARALRRTALTDELKERVRKRVVAMLAAGYLPREYREYAKLARKIGLGEWLAHLEGVPMENPWAQHYYKYFEEHAAH